LHTPKITFSSVKDVEVILCSIIPGNSNCQKDFVTSQWKSIAQGTQLLFDKNWRSGEQIILNLNNLSFVKTMSFNNLYRNSLIFVSCVTVHRREYIFSIPEKDLDIFAFKFTVKYFHGDFQNTYLSAFYVNLKRVVQGRTKLCCWLYLMISFHSLGTELTMPINLKTWTGDSHTCNNLSLLRNLPLSDIKSPILTIPWTARCFVQCNLFSIRINLLFHIVCFTTLSSEPTCVVFISDYTLRHSL